MQSNGTRDDPPVAQLVSEFASQTTTLVKQELELARLELAEKGKKAGAGAGLLGGAGVMAWFGLGALTAAAIIYLAEVLDEAWQGALAVAVAYFLLAALLALAGRGKAKQAAPLAPQQAIETTKEDLAVTKARVKEARS